MRDGIQTKVSTVPTAFQRLFTVTIPRQAMWLIGTSQASCIGASYRWWSNEEKCLTQSRLDVALVRHEPLCHRQEQKTAGHAVMDHVGHRKTRSCIEGVIFF